MGEYANDPEGFKQMLRSLKQATKLPLSCWFVCFENTGAYSKALLTWLVGKQIPCREENPIQIAKSLGVRRGKSDKIDAKAICKYTFEKRDSIQVSKLPIAALTKLKKLLSRRDLLVRQRQSLVVSLKEQVDLDPILFEQLEEQNQEILIIYDRQIKLLDKEITVTIQSDDQLKKNDCLGQSIIGIGPVISAYVIAFTQNYTCFDNARKFACYCGVAPFPNQSGKFKGKTSVSHMANKKIKSLLSNAVNAAIQHDKEIAQYYYRKIEEGKEFGVVANAIKNKLIHRLFAVIKRQTPFVRMMNYI